MERRPAGRSFASMFTTIVVGVDDSSGAEDALAFAHAMAGDDTRLVLVNAYPHEVLREQSLEILANAAGDAGDRRSLADDSPGRALQRVAHEEHAGLVVVGSCRYGAVSRVLLGDVSRAVMHGAPCPVAVVPRGWAERPHHITAIGVGFTRTPEAHAALELAAALARRERAALHLRTAVAVPVAFAPSYAYTYDWDTIEAEHRALARADLVEASADLGLPTIIDTPDGTASGALIELSEEVGVLVVGSRGYGATRRVVLGSTSDRVAHHAACPVIVVPATAVEAEAARAA